LNGADLLGSDEKLGIFFRKIQFIFELQNRSDKHIQGDWGVAMSSERGPAQHWLTGGGEMSDLVRAFDWSKTPLSPKRLHD